MFELIYGYEPIVLYDVETNQVVVFGLVYSINSCIEDKLHQTYLKEENNEEVQTA